MFLTEIPPSPYDWRFTLFGFPIRVAWTFWIFTAALCYSSAMRWSEVDGAPNMLVILAVSVAGVLVSILVHELGHAFMFRFYGVEASIVLYHFGGLAIPGGYGVWARHSRYRLTVWPEVIIAAAGPAAQVAFGIIVGLIAMQLGIQQTIVASLSRIFFEGSLNQIETPETSNILLINFVSVIVNYGILLAIINLVPILPLDGGRIAKGLIGMLRGTTGTYEATLLSAVVGILLGLYLMQYDQFFGVFVLILGISNLQSLQNPQGF